MEIGVVIFFTFFMIEKGIDQFSLLIIGLNGKLGQDNGNDVLVIDN